MVDVPHNSDNRRTWQQVLFGIFFLFVDGFLISMLTNSTEQPNSSATILIVSASKRWLIDTKSPSDIQAEITSVTLIFIMVANSATVTNSVSFRMLFSFSSCSSSARNFCCAASRLSRRCFAVCDFPLLPKRAKVSLICLSISSSEISVFSFFFFFSFFSSAYFLQFWHFWPEWQLLPPEFFHPDDEFFSVFYGYLHPLLPY